MTRWLLAWWRQLVGGPTSDPWHDDPRIRTERAGQHVRITKATASSVRQSTDERRARDLLLDIQSDPRGESVD